MARDPFIGFKVEQRPTGRQLTRMLDRIRDDMKDYRKAWRRIAKEIFIPSVKQSFRAKRSPDGQTWTPLTREYAARKKELGGSPRKLLQLSGTLRKSMTRVGRGSGANRIFGKRFMKFGTKSTYSVPLQWGYGASSLSTRRSTGRRRRSRSAGRRSDIEARPFLIVTKSMAEKAGQVFVEHLDMLIDKQAARTLARRRARAEAGGSR